MADSIVITGQIGDLLTKFDTYSTPVPPNDDGYTGKVVISGIKEYKVTRNKLWKEEKRNMAGELNAVFLGIYPKIEIKIKPTDYTSLQTLIGLFDLSYIKLKWYNPYTKSYKNGTFYVNDYSNELISKQGLQQSQIVTGTPGNQVTTKTFKCYYKEFDVHFIPIKRGGDDLSV